MENIDEGYDLELDKAVEQIKKQKAKRILIQLPEGLKPKATEIVDYFEKEFPMKEFLIWFDSCYGACDVPLETERLGIDLIIQFGHSEWSEKLNGVEVVK